MLRQTIFIAIVVLVNCSDLDDLINNPYGKLSHRPEKTYLQLQKEMIQLHSGHFLTNVTYEIFPLADTTLQDQAQYAKHQVAFDIGGHLINGRFFRLDNPQKHFSVLEPVNGCGKGLSTVRESAGVDCIIATNAGFFNTKTGECLGNVISDGKVVQTPGLHNANFGITKDGKIVVGYINATEIGKIFEFEQLVGGVIWLVRNGIPYVNTSELLEDMKTQETGPTFVTVRASRVALGHDVSGRIMVLVLDGTSSHDKGPNLHDMARIMIELGAVNAINLDGGGSSTVIENGALTNYVTDKCSRTDNMTKCERKVTTILCIHDYETFNWKIIVWVSIPAFLIFEAVIIVGCVAIIRNRNKKYRRMQEEEQVQPN